jgi:hypothetical protein
VAGRGDYWITWKVTLISIAAFGVVLPAHYWWLREQKL